MDRQKGIAIRKTLDQIGVKHSLKGHRYMISAIEKGLDDRSKLDRITKTLYVEIALENNDTWTRVESYPACNRNCLEKWQFRDNK